MRVVQEYRDLLMPSNPEVSGLNNTTIYQRMKSVHDKALSLRGKRREDFLDKAFTHPKFISEYLSDQMKVSPRKRELRKEIEMVKSENKNLKRRFETSMNELDKLGEENKNLIKDQEKVLLQLEKSEVNYGMCIAQMAAEYSADKDKNKDLQNKLGLLETEYTKVQATLLEIQDEFSNSDTRKLKRKVRDKEDQVKKQKVKVKNLSKELSATKKEVEKKSSDLHVVKDDLEGKEAEIRSLKAEKQKLQQKIYDRNKKSIKKVES